MEFLPHNGESDSVTSVGVLDKVMAVLHAYPDGTARLEPPEVAARLSISQPTAYRLMKAMAGHGLLERDPTGYRLGVTLLHLGSRVAEGLDVKHAAHQHLVWLRDETGENAELHLRHGHTRVPIDVVASRLNLRPMGQVGIPFPLHMGASSKVLLAWLEPDEVCALTNASVAAEPDPHPHQFDPANFDRELAETRQRGWASSDSEREAGVASFAAPVRDRFGVVVAALVVAGPSTRLLAEAAAGHIVKVLNEAAHRTSADLGYLATEEATR
jgi:IclR family acetate operon transcriptional repressor